MRIFPLNENKENPNFLNSLFHYYHKLLPIWRQTHHQNPPCGSQQNDSIYSCYHRNSIFIAFAVTGYWLEASVAAPGGGLSIAYYWRSSIGRIDTDQLNLGFLYFMFAMALVQANRKILCMVCFLQRRPD